MTRKRYVYGVQFAYLVDQKERRLRWRKSKLFHRLTCRSSKSTLAEMKKFVKTHQIVFHYTDKHGHKCSYEAYRIARKLNGKIVGKVSV